MRNLGLRRSFSLIELLMVVAIVAILTGLAMPNYIDAQDKAKFSRVQADFKHIATQLEYRKNQHGRYPARLPEPLTDPWNEAYVYIPGFEGEGYTLLSKGPDREQGTSDDLNASSSQFVGYSPGFPR